MIGDTAALCSFLSTFMSSLSSNQRPPLVLYYDNKPYGGNPVIHAFNERSAPMLLIELFVPNGALSTEQRHDLGKRLIEAISEESAPATIIEAWRAISQVVIYSPETWIVGGRSVEPTDPPRYIVRVSVPDAWREEMSAHAIARITRVLAEVDADPQRFYQAPLVWVHVIGVPEGSCGVLGVVMRSTDIIKMVTKPYREASKSRTHTEKRAPGTTIDPICGMTVVLNETAITLEHQGTTYAFCSAGCRTVLAEQLHAASSD
jgi:YHS domain-containing protein